MQARLRTSGRRRPSVYEVAERAGVSIATVSRVLSGSVPVAETTRQRVLAAAEELQWRPNRAARALSAQAHGAIGIVFPDLGGPYYSKVIEGFESTAVEQGTAALILATHGRPNAADLVHDLADRVDGLVVMGRTIADDLVARLDRPGTPVVLLARPAVGRVPAVRAGSLASAALLTDHLLDHGRRALCFLGDPARSPDVAERWRGVRRALRRRGLDRVATLAPSGGFGTQHGADAAGTLLASGAAVDAIVCANDELAAGAYQALAAAGRRVPDDVAVTGWDDTPASALLRPPLTTVRQPMYELGARAAQMLFERIADGQPSSVVLRTSLIVRESCGCMPRDRPSD